MLPPRHTPYDGSSKLFRIGLKPLDLAEWIDVDDRLNDYLAEKARLLAARPSEVFAAETGSEAAQEEVLSLLLQHLPKRFPAIYRRDGNVLHVGTDRSIRLEDGGPSLLTAARLVQEDLLLLRRDESGWRLVAGSLSFPSSWALADKMGRNMDAIHGPVPGFGEGTRNAELINRMFDSMRPETPMLRWNWSLYGDDRLFHPETASAGSRRFGSGPIADPVFLRTERQTLRRLPQSGDILFTVRIGIDPLSTLEQHSRRSQIATALLTELVALNDEQLAYKGMTAELDRVLERLRQLALP